VVWEIRGSLASQVREAVRVREELLVRMVSKEVLDGLDH